MVVGRNFPIGGSFSRCRSLVFAGAAVRCLEKYLGQRDCCDVVQIWVIDNRRADEKLNRQIGDLTGIANLFGKAEAIDFVELLSRLERRHIECGGPHHRPRGIGKER